MSAVLFFIAAIGVITGAIGVVVLRDAFYSVLALVVHLVSLAVLFLLLRAEFVAAVQVVVYAGAVMVLYVFVVAYVGGREDRFEDIGGAGSDPAQAGLEKCVGCSLCAAACPADCIRVVAAENTAENRVSPGERYAAVYEINLSRCIFCGYCEVACPFDAITMGHDYELSSYDRSDLIFTKEMLLAEPIERTPLRREGE